MFRTPSANAQEFGRIDELTNTGTAYYTFAQEGEATVQVIVLGSISRPGMYEVGISVDLGQLLALSGGPPLDRTSGVRSTHNETTLRLFRETTGRRDIVYEAPLDLMLSDPNLYPPLQEGDIFTVQTTTIERERFVWRDALSIFSTITSFALLIDRINRGN